MGDKAIYRTYRQEDFLSSTAPYEEAYSYHNNPFEYEQQITRLSKAAETVGFRGFRKMLSKYCEALKAATRDVYVRNATEFTGQPLELESNGWIANDFGVRRERQGGYADEACCHPIMPVERLVNIDTGVEKLRLWYTRGRRPRTIIVDKSILASPQKILSLSDNGIAVNSENAKALIQWLHDAENVNYDLLPERKSVSRLGYIADEGFSPYVDELIFDGDQNFKTIFESIRSAGKQDVWLQTARAIRKTNVMARIVLAASFASALVAPCGSLPFFVHLWGGESGTGKTVALMLAASVWGNPEMGRYIQTFNSTVVGREKLAAFLNHLPLLVDELQLAKDGRGKSAFDIYALAEGVGRTRGTKTGGIDKTPTWANCIITTGETPITTAGAGAGAVNRVIEIECLAAEKIIEDGHGVAASLKKNYGFAGRKFVKALYADGQIERAQALYRETFKRLSDNNTTEKQAMAAAVILVADQLATDWIFKDGAALTVREISVFLQSRAAVSAGARGYQYMCDWAAQNANRLRGTSDLGDVYGMIDGDWVYIIGSIFRRAAEEGGFSSQALLSYLKQSGLLQTRSSGRAMTKNKRINGVASECVCMKLPNDNPENCDYIIQCDDELI